MWVAFNAGGDRFQFRESYSWIPNWGVSFTFAADGIALVMLMLIAVLVPLVILASWHDAESSKRSVPVYFALLLVLECTMIGVFAAADVFLFYVFFEVMLVPMYFLIGSYGGHQRQYAAVKFFLYSLVGGLFMLAAVIGLWVVGGKTFDWQALVAGRHHHRHRAVAVPRLLPRVRDQGAVLPVPHLAARRRWRRPGRRGGAARRRAGQGRHVRHPALLPAAVPRGVEVVRAVGAGAGAWSASSTPRCWRSARTTSSGWCRTPRSRTSASSASASSPSPPRPAPARCSTWSTTAWPPACCSWWSACSSPGAVRR